jgi:hypothetical protein
MSSDDPLVGRWFHTWEELEEGENPDNRTVRNGRALVYQGLITEAAGGSDYFVQRLSFWDGCASGGELLVSREEMRGWTFYRTAVEMSLALGCRETCRGERPCGGEATHRTGLGTYVCGSCAGHYPGAEEVPDYQDRFAERAEALLGSGETHGP